MAQTNDELRRLIEKRGRLKLNLTRFKIFYDAHGQSTDSLQEWLNRTVLFIEVLQERIKTTVSHWLPPISLPSFSGVNGSSFAIALNRWLIAMTLSLTSRSFTTSYSLWRMVSRVLTSLEMSEDNYAIAWRLLRDRYEEKRTDWSSYGRDIRTVLDDIGFSVGLAIASGRLLQSMSGRWNRRGNLSSWDGILTHLLEIKLHPRMCAEWGWHATELGHWKTLKNLQSFIE